AEVKKSRRPHPERRLADDGAEPAHQEAGAGRVVHAGDTLHPTFASFVMLAHRTGVDRESQCTGPSGLHWTRQRGELPQQGASEAMISFTSKSSAAMQESAPP